MRAFRSSVDLLRARKPHEHGRVTNVELFFDLVFVFAITQISHFLLEHLSPTGAMQAALLFLAVWWVWIFTSWVTNWLDPDTSRVRLLMFALMLAGLVMSTSLPDAFGGRALAFASAYVFAQVGRSIFMLWCLHGRHPGNFRNFQRITAWLVLSGVFWISGAFASGEQRFTLWLIALMIEYVSPAVGFWTPGLGRSQTTDWDVEGDHMAERCGLFVIIALGESVLVTGATFAKMAWSGATIAAFVIAFAGSVAMWWIYFNLGAERGRHLIAGSDDPGRLARLGYTYLHMPIIAGIVVSAVSDELILAHPAGHTDFKTAATTIGGAAIFLIGITLFKNIVTRKPTLSHWVGMVLLAVVAPSAIWLPPLAFGALINAILILVAVWETIASSQSTSAVG